MNAIPKVFPARARHLEPRSVLIGLALGLLMAFAVAATTAPPGGPGRYQISAGSTHAFVVDTATGQVWEAFTAPDHGVTSAHFLDPKLP